MLVVNLFEAIAYLIVSPIRLPYLGIRKLVNYFWRRRIKIGDECFFINGYYGKTHGKVVDVDTENEMVKLECRGTYGYAFGWYKIKSLRVL